MNNKIVIAADIYHPDIGGPATYSKNLKEELTAKGWDVKLICYSDKKGDDVNRIVRSKIKPLHWWKYYRKLKEIARDCDVIYSMGPISAGVPAMKVAKKLNKKLVVKIVGDYAWEYARNSKTTDISIDEFQTKEFDGKTGKLKKLEAEVCKSANKVITPSQYLKNIVKGWGVDENKIEVIYNSLELRIMNQESSRDKQLIVSMGRLVSWKGFEAIIEALPDNFRLKIIGSGPDKEKLNNLVKKLNLLDRVEISEVDHGKVLDEISKAGCFILNSGYEGLSHSILEAMAAGIPVIVSDRGGNPELIKDEENGLLVEYNNKEQIKEAILKLYNNPELSKKFVQNSKEVLKKFTFEEMINKTDKLLKEL